MRIFIAGATGTLGRPVVRRLRLRGHEVIGLTRSHARASALTAQGVRAVVGDALDGDGLRRIVAAERPDQVVHLLTALPPGGPLRKRHLAPTNELRTRGTANLIQAAIAAGAGRLVAESFVGIYGPVATDRRIPEDEPLPPVARGTLADAIGALRAMESQLRDVRTSGRLTTVALRIGFLYGSGVPGTRDLMRQALARRLFAPREFTGVGPFVHVDDAASAIVAAVEHAEPSAVYNVVDDEPVALRTFLVQLAAAIGAAPPRHIPRWVVRLAAPLLDGFGTTTLMLANDRIKRELGWMPRYPTVNAGLAEVREGVTVAA